MQPYVYYGAIAVVATALLILFAMPYLSGLRRQSAASTIADANTVEAAVNTLAPFIPPTLVNQIVVEAAKGRWEAKAKASTVTVTKITEA